MCHVERLYFASAGRAAAAGGCFSGVLAYCKKLKPDHSPRCSTGMGYKRGELGTAFEYWLKAADLGYAEAHNNLSIMYRDGEGVEKDIGKETYHLEEAAIGGHPQARYNLGCIEGKRRNIERSVKHWNISATQGYDTSIKMLMKAFKSGFVDKDVLASALRAQKAAVDETKSPQRNAAEEFYRTIGRTNLTTALTFIRIEGVRIRL